MSKFIALAVAASACGAAVLVAVLSATSPSPPSAPRAPHSEFADRLQPKLDGIGSTRDLAPVSLSGRHGGSQRYAPAQPGAIQSPAR